MPSHSSMRRKSNIDELGETTIYHVSSFLTPRAPDRATEFKLSKCSKGKPPKGNGEATPSSGPVSLLVREAFAFAHEPSTAVLRNMGSLSLETALCHK
jgi:hypothetical protein